jgi:hypothetical protein
VTGSRVGGSSGNSDGRREGNGGALMTAMVMAGRRQISVARRCTLRNPLGSRVLRCDTVCYIGGRSLVSVVLNWPIPKIMIFGGWYYYIAGIKNYRYRLY